MYDSTIPNPYLLSWYVTVYPTKNVLWIGWPGVSYPNNSHEMQPVQSNPHDEYASINLWVEGKALLTKYRLNPLYSEVDHSLQWLYINPYTTS